MQTRQTKNQLNYSKSALKESISDLFEALDIKERSQKIKWAE